MIMSLLANIGIILINIYATWKVSLSSSMQAMSEKKRVWLYIAIQSLTGMTLLHYSFIILGTHFNFRAILYAFTLKYLGKKVAFPTILFVGTIRFFFEGTYSDWLNSIVVLIILLTYSAVFDRAKRYFSDLGQLLTLLYYYEVLSFLFTILALNSVSSAFIITLIMTFISTILVAFIHIVMTDVQHLSNLSKIDDLTQLYNARKLNDDLTRLSARVGQHCILVIDIDDFKGINDTYGHIAGDMVLKQIGNKLSIYSYEAQTLYRYGGEEFIAIVESSNGQNAVQLAQEILENLRMLEVTLADGLKLNITVSIGIAYRDQEENLINTFKRADSALYTAKNNGKNQIYLIE